MERHRKEKRKIRHKRVRSKIKDTALVPRLCVFRSNKGIYCQLINDEENKIILSASDKELKKTTKEKKTEIAFRVGEALAKKVKENLNTKKIEKVIFDRAGYKYHGRIKALAEGARKGGLKF